MRRFFRLSLACAALTTLAVPSVALAEPTDPVVIGWWSYFTPEGPQYQVPTTDPAHPVTMFGDPDTYYYEPSGGHGMQEDPNVLPKDKAWQNIVNFVLAKSNNVTLSPEFTIDTSSDLNQFTEAYFGWALVLLYVPKDKYCDQYRIHIGSVDDGVQAMANEAILGYANLGDQDKYIDMVEYNSNPPKLVLRPGINEVVIIHEDQAAVQRYVHNVWIEHNGQKIPLASKSIAYGRVVDAATQAPIYESLVGINGAVNDTFLTGPLGFYFFAGLADGTYGLTANKGGYKTKMANAAVALGQAATEVVRTDLALDLGCSCPNGKVCGPNGGCLDPCIMQGEFGEVCTDPAATCVNQVCVKDPCDTMTCKPGFECENVMQGMPPKPAGVCVENACSNICCSAGQVCSAGLCVQNNCGAGCPAGQTCAGGACVDACTVITCVADLVCKDGVCEPKCAADPASCQPDGGIGVGNGGGVPASSTGGTGSGGAGSGGGKTSATGAGGGTASGDAPGSTGGCGCRAAGTEVPSGLAVAIAGAAGLVLRRRRRDRRSAPRR